MHSLLNEIDLTYNGQMELQDYLQVNHQAYTWHIFFSALRSSLEIKKYRVKNFMKFYAKSTPIWMVKLNWMNIFRSVTLRIVHSHSLLVTFLFAILILLTFFLKQYFYFLVCMVMCDTKLITIFQTFPDRKISNYLLSSFHSFMFFFIYIAHIFFIYIYIIFYNIWISEIILSLISFINMHLYKPLDTYMCITFTDDVSYKIWSCGIFTFRTDGWNGGSTTWKRNAQETNKRREIGWRIVNCEERSHLLTGCKVLKNIYLTSLFDLTCFIIYIYYRVHWLKRTYVCLCM